MTSEDKAELGRVLLEFFQYVVEWREFGAVGDVARERLARVELLGWLRRLAGDPLAAPAERGRAA